jgi:phosphohistidine phosphatase
VKVGLLRHAKSDWSDEGLRDFDRGLNERGRRGAALMGRHVMTHGVRFARVIASPAERVRQTLAAALPDDEPTFDRRLYLAPAETIIEVLREGSSEDEAVLIVGHNPGLQDTILRLVAPDREGALFQAAKVKFPTASFAVLDLPAARWGDIAEESGELVHFTRPRDLDAELGPEHP